MINLTILILLIHGAFGHFSNEVIYPTRSDDGIYRFYLEVGEGLSMAYWNSSRGTYQVVMKQNNTFYYRDRSWSTSCDALKPLDMDSMDSVIMGSGKHKNMILVNKTFPGPPIVVPLNSMVHVTVKNNMMTDVLSIHWHGQNQQNTFYMDGVSRVTQCPIGPGEMYFYEFKATELGTHW